MVRAPLGELFLGLATALVSVLLVGGALIMSLAEGKPPSSPVLPSPTPGNATPLPIGETPTLTSTPLPTSISCPPPGGWQQYTVQSGDTLEQLAVTYGIPKKQIQDANCMLNSGLLPDSILFLPPRPTETSTPTPPLPTATQQPPQPTDTLVPTDTNSVCVVRPPAGWVTYQVKQGDTLYQISRNFHTTMSLLMQVNCIPDPDRLLFGKFIYVPNVATSTATSTNAPPQPTTVPSKTPVPPTITYTPTPTFTSIPTATSTSTSTATSTATSTDTATPTATPTPTNTATITPTGT